MSEYISSLIFVLEMKQGRKSDEESAGIDIRGGDEAGPKIGRKILRLLFLLCWEESCCTRNVKYLFILFSLCFIPYVHKRCFFYVDMTIYPYLKVRKYVE